MTVSSVRELLAADRWAIAQGDSPAGPSVIRYRQPILQPAQTAGYHRCLRIVWAYADEGSGALPDTTTGETLETFENRLVAALEKDAVAVLTAVLTFDGARQWVFYTPDASACGARINAMPQEQDPYPIELDVFTDTDWQYLREQILASVARDA